MRAIMLLVKRNLQDKKTYSIVILFLSLLSTLCLITAFGTIVRTGEIYDNITQQTNSPQMLLAFESSQYSDSYEKELKTNGNVTDVVLEDYFYGSYRYDNEDKVGGLLIPYNPSLNTYHTKYNESVDTLSNNEILLPSSMEDSYNIKQNDIVEFKVGDELHKYKVKDFIEDPFFGSVISTSKRIYISDEEYKNIIKLSEQTPVLSYKVLSVYIDKENVDQGIFDLIYKDFTGSSKISWSVDQILLRAGNILLPTLLAFIFIIFSIFLFVITALILRYSILETVESDFTKIGVLKALGFSNISLICSFIMQYLIVAMIGSLLGALISVFITPIFGSIILSLSGLWWTGNISFSLALSIMILIIIFVLVVASITSLKVLKISPVRAIMIGKNPNKGHGLLSVSLTKMTYIPLNLRISIKQMLSKIKQYSTLIIISILFAFLVLSMSALTSFFNDKEKMVNFLGFDSSDILLSDSNIMSKNNEDLLDLSNAINKKYPVKNSIGFHSVDSNINGHTLTALVYDHYIEEENINMLDGKAPISDNEISITPTIQSMLNINIGDTVFLLDENENEQNFKVSGIHQSIEDMGNNIKISTSGYKRVDQSFSPMAIKLNIESSYVKDNKQIIDEFKDYSTSIVITDGSELYNDTVDMVQKGLLAGTIIMIMISLFMILLSTLLLSTITITREKTDNGIMKAIGYTNKQLQFQLIARFTLLSLCGSLIGALIAWSTASTLFSKLFNSIGVAKIVLNWDPLLIGSIVLSITISTMISSLFLSYRIKKIKTRDLIVE